MECGGGMKQEEEEGEVKELPPGFRFHPTDEELITHYLTHKITDKSFGAKAIAEVDLTKCEPWDLPEKAKMGEKEWYFFSLRDRKYPTGLRTNRATTAGYWKTTGKDKEIFDSSSSSSTSHSELVGMKKTLVFYKGRAPRGEKTNWVMHEYRLHHSKSTTTRDEWVVCRVFMKSAGGKKYSSSNQPRANPYHVELGPPPIMPSLLQNDPFLFARNYLPNAELMELSRFARGTHGAGLMSSPIQPQLNYPRGGVGGFTLAGLNLNLGAPPPPPPQTALLPMPTAPLSQPPLSAMAAANGVLGAMDGGGFSAEGRYQHHDVEDSRVELEGYWAPY